MNRESACYAAYALWRIGKAGVPSLVLAVTLTLLMTAGSIIELFPIHNDATITILADNDRLTTWVLQNTQPRTFF